MKRFISPFVLILTTLFGLLYSYAVLRLEHKLIPALLLALPFILVWSLPVLYWSGKGRKDRAIDRHIHRAGYLSMALLSFFFVGLLSLEVLTFIFPLSDYRRELVYSFTLIAMLLGYLRAKYGPAIRQVDVPLPQLPKLLDGHKIVQITDLHVGLTLGREYVEQVVKKTKELAPDMVVLTGDLVDGSTTDLLEEIAPLAQLAQEGKAFISLGNHDYYSGAESWTSAFRKMGFKVLINEHEVIEKNGEQILVAGITDPAAHAFDKTNIPDAKLALKRGSVLDQTRPSIKLLLAHNPKLAPMGEAAGFDFMMSGHTHAGQFIPWTLVVRMVHRPHYWGLSNSGHMKVYVGAGTGTWGPPIRFGTRPELTLLRLKSADPDTSQRGHR